MAINNALHSYHCLLIWISTIYYRGTRSLGALPVESCNQAMLHEFVLLWSLPLLMTWLPFIAFVVCLYTVTIWLIQFHSLARHDNRRHIPIFHNCSFCAIFCYMDFPQWFPNLAPRYGAPWDFARGIMNACESCTSLTVGIKSKYRSKIDIEREMCVTISNTVPWW